MKRKSIIIVIIIILVVLFSVYWGLIKNDNISNRSGFYPGQIDVYFKPGTSEKVALEILNKYNLTPESPDEFFRYGAVEFHGPVDKLSEYSKNIDLLPNIVEAKVLYYESSKEYLLYVDFQEPASDEEIQKILKDYSGLYLTSYHYESELLQHILTPVGKEEYFVNLLKKEPSIRTVEKRSIVWLH